MATVLDLVKHYQHAIEKYPDDEHKILKCIDKLFNLDVTVQHLQETRVGRTINALRKEAGDVGHAARALVYKWKLMVAAEESDQDGDHNNDKSGYNGHENGKDSDDNIKQPSKSRNDHNEKYSPSIKTEPNEVNGNYSGSKRKYQSSEDEEPNSKKSKSLNNSYDVYKKKPVEQDQMESYESDDESEDSDHSRSDDSDSEMSVSSDEEKHTKREIKQEPTDKHRSSSSKHSSHKSAEESKREPSSLKKSYDSEKHSHKNHKAEATDKYSSKEKSHSSNKHENSNEKDKIEKSSQSGKLSSEKDKKQKEDSKSSSSKHKSDTDKHKSSKTDSNVEKHAERQSSKSDKHRSSSHSQKSDKDKHKSSSEKEIPDEKHRSKHSSSSREKNSSSSKERSKDRSSSSKEKTDSSAKDHNSHKNEKKHTSSESKSKHSDSKYKADKRDEGNSETKSRHKSSSSSSHKSKSSSSKSKDEVPKKTNQVISSVDSDDGIDCGSGASFAEALGMISPAKSKKKSAPLKEMPMPISNDLSPASLLAPTAKLAPLPAIEISALPEISPNYKPRPPPKLLPHFTDEDAMSMTMSSKNQRTKVYSGNKVIGKISTLYEMCVQVLQEHIDALEYTGGVPYDILKPVIDRATPQQMFVLEHYNPYLMEDTDHLWQKFCEKNFRNKKRQEMETWREMYIRCQEEQEHRLKSLTANIRIAQEAKKAPIKQTKMAYVDSVVKPPRNIARKQAQHGTAHAASASPAARVASLAAAPNVLRGNTRPTPSAPGTTSSFKPKKAPLMQKALQFMRGRKR